METNLTYTPSPQEYAAIYARKSNRMESNSLESQITVAKKRVNELGLFVYDEFRDEESATKYHPLHRPGFKALLYAAKEGKFKTLIVFRRDRLARNVENYLEIRNIFKSLGIKIIYSNEGEFQASDSYISNFIENIIMAVDELEPSILHERILAGKREKRLSGVVDGALPFGLKKIDGTGEIIHIQSKADIIKKMFKLFMSLEITEDIFSNLLKEISPLYKVATGKPLQKPILKKFIANPKYAGLLQANPKESLTEIVTYKGDKLEVDETKFIIATNLKGIITPSEWFEVLKKYFLITDAENIIPSDPNDIFQNLLYCKKCSEKINLYNDKVYQCRHGCSYFDKDVLQTNLLRKITFDIFDSENFTIYQTKQKQSYDRDIKSLESELNSIKTAQKSIIKDMVSSKKLETNRNDLKSLLEDEKHKNNQLFELQRQYIDKEITIEELQTFDQQVNYSALILQLMESRDYAKIMLSNIIKSITISGSKEENLFEEDNRIIDYNS